MRFEQKSELHFLNLRPGESKRAEFSFQVAEGVDKIVVTSASTTANASKAMLGVFKKKSLESPRWEILPEVGSELARSLFEKGVCCHLIRDGVIAGEVWLALGPQSLGLAFAVHDHQITRGQPVWKGSCLELFAKCADSEISQIFLCPSTQDSPPAAFELNRSASAIVADPRIAIRELQKKADNYKIVATVPLSILRIQSTAREFRMEIVLTSATSPESGPQRTALFHPVEDPSTNSRGFGFIKAY